MLLINNMNKPSFETRKQRKNHIYIDIANAKNMRHKKKMTLQAIANHYQVSREYIRQLIGNTGRIELPRVKERKEKYLAHLKYKSEREIIIKNILLENKDKSNKYIAKLLNINYTSNISRLREKYGVHINELSSRGKGSKSEKWVSDYLKDNNIPNNLMPTNHPFDIMTDSKRINVKASFSLTKNNSHTFCLSGKNNCDYFILYIPPNELFVVPSLESKYGISIPFSRKTKYMKYYNRLDLLLV